MSKVQTCSHEITNKPLRVPASSCYENTSRLATWKTKYNAEKCTSEVKKWRIVINRISKERQTTCNWIKKILDEATRKVNVFLKSWFFYLFMFNKLPCNIWFHIAVRSRSKCYKSVYFHWKLSSNQRKTNRFPAKFARKALTKSAVLFTNRFSAKLASKIPAKFPGNQPLFLRICPWKSRDLPEALGITLVIG